LDEIEEFFGQEVMVTEDREHSREESTMIAAGLSRGKRPMFVAFTLRFRGKLKFIRVISARYMHKKERELYENIKKTLEK